jgi:hypothetical protein
MSLTDTPKLSTSTSYNYVKHSTCNVYCTGSGDALTGSNADAANRTMLNIAFILFILHYLIYRLILLRAQLFTGPGSPETGGETPFFAPFGSTLSFFLEFLLFFFFFFFFLFFFAFSPFAFQLPHNFLERSMVRSRGTLSFSNWIYLGLYAFSHSKIYINPFVTPRISVLQHIHFKVHSFFLFTLFSLEIDSRCIPYICRPDSIHIPTISFSTSFYLSR